jgi:hypothetical protein
MISPPFVFGVEAAQGSDISEDIRDRQQTVRCRCRQTLNGKQLETSLQDRRFQIDGAEIQSLYWRGS